MTTRRTAEGLVDRGRRAGEGVSWMERLARCLELSAYDLWVIILTVATVGVLYLIGEVAARLNGM